MTEPSPRLSLPAGSVPAYRDFARHVWRYRDELGDSALTPPPGNVFTLPVLDADEAGVAVTVAAMLDSSLGFEGRINMVWADSSNASASIEFRTLAALHAFLQILSWQLDHLPARELALRCMAALGVRWT